MTYIHMYGVLYYLDGSRFNLTQIISKSSLEDYRIKYQIKCGDYTKYKGCLIYFKSFDHESVESELIDSLHIHNKVKEIRIINA